MNVEQAPKKYNKLAIISLILSITPYLLYILLWIFSSLQFSFLQKSPIEIIYIGILLNPLSLILDMLFTYDGG